MSTTTATAKNPIRKIAAAVGITVASVVALAGPAAAQDVEPDAVPVNTCTFAGETVQTELVTEECVALEKLWHALNGPDWYHKGDWVTATDPCQGWYGIWCDAGHVQSIDFTYFNPGTGGGHLPEAIGEFEGLEYLTLPYSGLTGAIPQEIEDLDELVVLDLSYNGFTSLPEIDGLDAIESVRLDSNRLTGNITSFASAIRDTAIDRRNDIPGIPLEATPEEEEAIVQRVKRNRGGIEFLIADGSGGNECLNATDVAVAAWLDQIDGGWNTCAFGGNEEAPRCSADGIVVNTTLPKAECEALIDFHTSTNGPAWDFNPVDEDGQFINDVYEYDNWRTGDTQCAWVGVVCRVDENGVPHVVEISVKAGLTGTLPASLGNLTELESLDVHENAIGGAVPAAIAELEKVVLFFLHGNHFTGPIPTAFEDRIKTGSMVLMHSNCYAEGTILPGGDAHQEREAKCD